VAAGASYHLVTNAYLLTDPEEAARWVTGDDCEGWLDRADLRALLGDRAGAAAAAARCETDQGWLRACRARHGS
jgi:hypothetical protein